MIRSEGESAEKATTGSADEVTLGEPRHTEGWVEHTGAEAAKRIASRVRREWIFGWARRAGVPPRPLLTKYDGSFFEHTTRWIEGADRGGSMLLAGGPGVGKTLIAVQSLLRFAFYGRVWEPDLQSTMAPPPELAATYYSFPSAYFVTASRLYEAVFQKRESILLRATRARLLVVDDWGAQYEHEWPLARMDSIIDARWSHMRPTIVTTNIYPDEESGGERGESLEAVYPRIFSRLVDREGPGVVVLRGPDRRRQGG